MSMNPLELLEIYEKNAQEFLTIARQIPNSNLHKQASSDEWSAAFVIHHMTDSELQFSVRYANSLSVDNPLISVFDDSLLAKGLQYEKRDPLVSLEAFSAVNRLNLQVLQNASAEDWNRTSVHPEKSKVYLTSIVKLCGNHIGSHIEQLSRFVQS